MSEPEEHIENIKDELGHIEDNHLKGGQDGLIICEDIGLLLIKLKRVFTRIKEFER